MIPAGNVSHCVAQNNMKDLGDPAIATHVCMLNKYRLRVPWTLRSAFFTALQADADAGVRHGMVECMPDGCDGRFVFFLDVDLKHWPASASASASAAAAAAASAAADQSQGPIPVFPWMQHLVETAAGTTVSLQCAKIRQAVGGIDAFHPRIQDSGMHLVFEGSSVNRGEARMLHRLIVDHAAEEFGFSPEVCADIFDGAPFVGDKGRGALRMLGQCKGAAAASGRIYDYVGSFESGGAYCAPNLDAVPAAQHRVMSVHLQQAQVLTGHRLLQHVPIKPSQSATDVPADDPRAQALVQFARERVFHLTELDAAQALFTVMVRTQTNVFVVQTTLLECPAKTAGEHSRSTQYLEVRLFRGAFCATRRCRSRRLTACRQLKQKAAPMRAADSLDLVRLLWPGERAAIAGLERRAAAAAGAGSGAGAGTTSGPASAAETARLMAKAASDRSAEEAAVHRDAMVSGLADF